jgi:hypothetical protein
VIHFSSIQSIAVAHPAQYRHSADWLAYFRRNQVNRLAIPWDCSDQITDAERQAIAHSIQNFQLGESSEGVHLMKLAREYAEQTGDRHWVEVVKLFIGEEQRHARELGRFMQQQQIPLARHHWSDTVFRKLRRLANLEVAFRVLLAAELIATLYYPALGKATRSPILQQLCAQISLDERQHVRFQSEQLSKIRQRRPRWLTRLIEPLYACFFRATVLVVWFDHHPVLKRSEYSFWSFYRAACAAFKESQSGG